MLRSCRGTAATQHRWPRCRSDGRRRTAAPTSPPVERCSQTIPAGRSPGLWWRPGWRAVGSTDRLADGGRRACPSGRSGPAGKRSTLSWGWRPNADAVIGSVPGARPIPRSIRPGCSASNSANCSAIARGAWLGSITPPEPIRIASVAAARCAISTLGVVLATVGMLWCSATQKRRNPRWSACRASRVVSARASADDPPARTTAKSSTESGTTPVKLWRSGRTHHGT